jgi:hypothetical protein
VLGLIFVRLLTYLIYRIDNTIDFHLPIYIHSIIINYEFLTCFMILRDFNCITIESYLN